MKVIYVKSLDSKCETCECDLTNGGYIYFGKNATIDKCLCPQCEELQKDLKAKPKKIVVKKLTGNLFTCLLFKNHYQVLSTKNIIVKDNILIKKEVEKIMLRPDIELDIKY